MRHAMSFFSLTLLLLQVTRVHGIRLLKQEEHMVTVHNKIHEESLKGGGSAFGEEDSCRNDGHCSGRSRKLITQTMTTSKSERSSNKAVTVDYTPRSGHDSKEIADPNREDLHSATPASQPSATSSYPDILDIAGMDYSPAKRKPPIHN
ncbi:uncharacterized protein LOC109706678 isoform X2 [Ananas comosus]|uniref:Uncharacterized protein LOC109706678 isoform X2 n=1 Tax=Ananas comosus TaxID=4615 RepID=A0A6P5EIF9_ANACO|nr:uncharacterized protein LOC109706678 isoform X2 [Ananas comosus]